MIGRKALILTLLVVLVSQVVFPINHANAQVVSRPDCASKLNIGSVLSFVGTTGATWAALAGINFTTSTLASITVEATPFGVGFTIGDFFEPLDEAVDYLYNVWVKALFWGIVATFGAALAGYLVEFAIDLNLQLLTSNDIVNVGYGTVLALVNLGFVIAIIIIAFATMFRRSGWDMQSSLAKLIIAALLINFSLFLAGIVLDLGTSLTRVLLSNACPGVEFFNKFNIVTIQSDVSAFLSTSVTPPDSSSLLGIVKGVVTFDLGGLWNSVSSYFTGMIAYIAGKFFVAILSVFFASALTIIGALSLLAIFLFLIARYVAITILLIFMPIAWLGLIFPKMNVPGLGNAWSGWWTQFLKWVFTGPLLAFFLWLTVQFIDSFGSLTTPSLIQGIGQMIVVIVFSLSTLWVANKLGVVGAGMIYGGVDKIIKSGAASLKATGIGIATAPLRTEAGQKISQAMARGKLNLLGVSIPTGTNPLGRDAIIAGASTRVAGKAALKDMKDMNKEEKNAAIQSYGINTAERVTALADMFKNKKTRGDIIDPGQYINSRHKEAFRRQGLSKVYEDMEKSLLLTTNTRDALKKNDQQRLDREADKIVKGWSPTDLKENAQVKEILNKEAPASLSKEEHNRRRDAFFKAIFNASSKHVSELYKSMDRQQKIDFPDQAQDIIHKLGGEGKLNADVRKWWESRGGKGMFGGFYEFGKKGKDSPKIGAYEPRANQAPKNEEDENEV